MKKKQLRARSPAKLILSGEHAVVYGKPAIAMAVDCYAESMIISNLSSAILFNCLNLKYARSFTRKTLQLLKGRVQDQYHIFLEGKCSIREVIKKPFELLQFTVSHLLETLNISLPEGLEIRSSSDIPMGCGMGSSAAVVMSTLYALNHFLGLNLDPVKFHSLGIAAENLQHGRSSGVDLQLAMSGGCLRYANGRAEQRVLPSMPMAIVQTGTPETTTGECVSAVQSYFTKGTMADEFAAVTDRFDQALQQNDQVSIREGIKENHRLLTRIGVVPEKVQAFIRDIEQVEGAAKICGAGAVKGDRAGVVLVLVDENVTSIVEQYGYHLQAIKGDLFGTCIV